MAILSSTIDRLDLKRFFQGEGPQEQPIHLHQRKVYILPTKHGLTFALILVVMLVGSINYSNSLGFMLTFLLASLVVITILYTYRNLLNLKIRLGDIENVYCQQKVSIPFLISNINYERFSLSVSYEVHSTKMFDLPVETEQIISYQFKTTSRGKHRLKKFTFSTTFPLGLFRAWSYFEIDKEYLVYPKPEGKPQLPQQAYYKATLFGDQGQGTDDFAGQRKYVPGDSLKQVNWKALAKQQDMLTKQFGGDRHEELWLDWSTTENLSFEQRLSQLALWVLEAERLGYSYGLKLPNQEISPSRGEKHLHHCMSTLAVS